MNNELLEHDLTRKALHRERILATVESALRVLETAKAKGVLDDKQYRDVIVDRLIEKLKGVMWSDTV